MYKEFLTRKNILALLGLLLVAVTLPLAGILVKQSQEVRKEAAACPATSYVSFTKNIGGVDQPVTSAVTNDIVKAHVYLTGDIDAADIVLSEPALLEVTNAGAGTNFSTADSAGLARWLFTIKKDPPPAATAVSGEIAVITFKVVAPVGTPATAQIVYDAKTTIALNGSAGGAECGTKATLALNSAPTPSVTPAPVSPIPTPTCITGSGGPVDVMLVIDRSGSMGGQPLADEKVAAKAFVDVINFSRDQVGLVSFETDAQLDQQLTHTASLVKTAIDALVVGGSTNMAQGIILAQNELTSVRHNASAQKVIVLMSDGAPTTPQQEVVDAAQAAKAAGTKIFTIGVDQGVIEALMKQIATAPEYYYYAPTSAGLTAIYQAIAGVVACASPTGGPVAPTPTGPIVPTPTGTRTPTPTGTISPTPTPTGGAAKVVNFKLKLRGITTQPSATANQTLNFKVKIVTANDQSQVGPVYTPSGTVGTDGVWTIPVTTQGGLVPGAYNIYIKGPKHLQKKFANVSFGSTWPTTVDFTNIGARYALDPGDLPIGTGGVQDGVVNSMDAVYLTSCFATPDNATCLAKADLNLDGMIGVIDMELLNGTVYSKWEDEVE